MAAARGGDNDLLALGEAFDAVFGVAERGAGNQNAVDPRLQLGRDGEIVHRRTDHHDIGAEKLFQRGAAGIKFRGKRGLDAFRASRGRHQMGTAQMRQGRGDEIAVGYGGGVCLRLQARNDRCGQAAGNRVIAEDSGVDMQNVHNGTFVVCCSLLRCTTYVSKTIGG